MNASAAPTLDQTKDSPLAKNAVWFFVHIVVSVLAWGAMMLGITLFHPDFVPPAITWAASFAVPFFVGYFLMKRYPTPSARIIWVAGFMWLMFVGLWILDMPTGPSSCLHCDASSKLWLTFFSINDDSGLIDGQGRFLGTWPATAMIGYALGAGAAIPKPKKARAK
jgi:hypothetical protein